MVTIGQAKKLQSYTNLFRTKQMHPFYAVPTGYLNGGLLIFLLANKVTV